MLINHLLDKQEKTLDVLLSPNPLAVGNALNVLILNGDSQLYQLEIWSAVGKKVRACLVGTQLPTIGNFCSAFRSAISHLAMAKLLP